jgi:hypothetical protein
MILCRADDFDRLKRKLSRKHSVYLQENIKNGPIIWPDTETEKIIAK